MKRASYRAAIEFIGLNDEAAELDVAVMADVPSVMLTAAIFDVTQTRVASDVVRWRLNEQQLAETERWARGSAA